MLVFIPIFFWLFSQSWAYTCDYAQILDAGTTYYAYNPKYPSKDNTSETCNWKMAAPEHHTVKLECNIDIPPSSNCDQGVLSISLSGDSQKKDRKNYCGIGTFTLYSLNNKMSIVFTSVDSADGGRFLCSIVTVPPKCDCGWQKHVRIVGGTEASPNEFPMMAGLVDISLGFIYCGATIISLQYVVTAAHCCKGRNLKELAVVVGEHDVRIGNETSATQLLKVVDIITHPKSDISLVKLSKRIQYSGLVGPACLPLKYLNADFTGLTVDVMGWGTVGFGTSLSPVLLKTQVVIQTNATCQHFYKNNIPDDEFCAYGNATDTCQSDSGGPLLWLDPTSQRWNILGITSRGFPCATNHPSVNVKVAALVHWITKHTPEVQYCYK